MNPHIALIELLIELTKRDKISWSKIVEPDVLKKLKPFTMQSSIVEVYACTMPNPKSKDVLTCYIIKQNNLNPQECIIAQQSIQYPYMLVAKKNDHINLLLTVDKVDFSSKLQELYEIAASNRSIADIIKEFISDIDNYSKQ